MSGKHRKSKGTGKEGHSSGSLPVKAPTSAKSTSAPRKTTTTSAPRKTTTTSARRKLVLFLASPAVITGIVGAVPQGAIETALMMAHEIAAQSPHYKPPDPFSGRRRSDVTIGSGGFTFGGGWENYAIATSTNQAIAAHLAAMVVDVASEDAGYHINPGDRWRYTQWVLAGGMTPAEAAEVINKESTPQLETLLDVIQKDHSIATNRGTVTLGSRTWEQSAQTSAEPETKVVRQQPQRQSRSKRTGKR